MNSFLPGSILLFIKSFANSTSITFSSLKKKGIQPLTTVISESCTSLSHPNLVINTTQAMMDSDVSQLFVIKN